MSVCWLVEILPFVFTVDNDVMLPLSRCFDEPCCTDCCLSLTSSRGYGNLAPRVVGSSATQTAVFTSSTGYGKLARRVVGSILCRMLSLINQLKEL